MTKTASVFATILFGLGCVGMTLSAQQQDVITVDDQIRVIPFPIAERWLNPWPQEYEDAFWARANELISKHARPRGFGNKHFENEKSSYPNAFMAFLAGHRQPALEFLQAEDTQAGAWHQHTEGIDFYAAFTLKGQMRKYFFFGPWMNPEYVERMKRGAANWTRTDPRTTPHPVFQRYNPNLQGWTPERFGHRQVDGRRTDNLFAMSTTATFLMAEETGNTEVMEIYRDHINRYVWALYNVGMGEWDSATYHGHTFAAYLNLYDFTRDEQMKGVAKAALDYLSTMMAFKYFRGGFVRPSKRDNAFDNVVLGGDQAKFAWLYFGENDAGATHFESDQVHAMLSAYRPPRTVMALARNDFPRPVEVLSTKIEYENWNRDADDSHSPRHFETMYIANTYQLGSITPRGPEGDVAPFNLVVNNSQRGADYFVAATSVRDNMPRLGIDAGVQIAQFENLLVWLRDARQGEEFVFQVPAHIERSEEQGVWFFEFEETWLALWPINLAAPERREPTGRAVQRTPNERSLVAAKSGGPFYGFAMEVGEAQSHGSFADFRQAVLRRSRLNLDGLDQGTVRLTGAQETFIELSFPRDGGMAGVNRNGTLRNFDDPAEWALMRTVSGHPVLNLGWKEGELTVNAGGHIFQSRMNRAGETAFSETPVTP